ncbi:MAG: AbrB/MazE/SpoVT family DNA-binding domain-containing protein [Nitrospirota bacterium]|nr:AbrB/MazE/SpoVT family DNA-binding domain-containing protein [Nitrospirota bacterium]MDH5776450.1 AbrB/MazE/SpoVT family DNA-binding domain-containing protein [Nitrospirota bacterium]
MLDMKVRKVGNSLGVVLPKEVLSRLNVQDGDKVFLTEAPDGSYRITPYDPEFEQQLNIGKKFMAQYRNTLRALAK